MIHSDPVHSSQATKVIFIPIIETMCHPPLGNFNSLLLQNKAPSPESVMSFAAHVFFKLENLLHIYLDIDSRMCISIGENCSIVRRTG